MDSNGNDIDGDSAYQKLLDAISKQTFQLDVYKIDLNQIYSWIDLHHLNEVVTEINSDTISLEDLINKTNKSVNVTRPARALRHSGLLVSPTARAVALRCLRYSMVLQPFLAFYSLRS